MILGNIVSDDKLSVLSNFNVVKSLDDTIEGLPTLIIDWEYIKQKYPDYDIIDRKIDENLYWTFKRHEKRDIHQEDIYNFCTKTYFDLINKVKYFFIDVITYKKNVIKNILKKINNCDNIITYRHDMMIYMYVDNIIFGIDLNLIEFIGLNVDKLIVKINKKNRVFLEKDIIFIEYKNIVEHIDNQVKYIPYLYSLKNG